MSEPTTKWRVHFDFEDQRAAITYDSKQKAQRKADVYGGTDPQPVTDRGDEND